jgi:CheY-specific phosphatase CheX
VEDVLAKMFFVETLGESSQPGAPCADVIGAKVAFEGEPAGALTIRLTTPAASQIAADFLGLDEEEVSPSRVAEVVCELANMICGSVLSRVESATTFRLATPRIVPLPECRSARGGAIRYAAELSNGELAVDLDMSTPT